MVRSDGCLGVFRVWQLTTNAFTFSQARICTRFWIVGSSFVIRILDDMRTGYHRSEYLALVDELVQYMRSFGMTDANLCPLLSYQSSLSDSSSEPYSKSSSDSSSEPSSS